jgi:hypothetical protein
MKRSAMRGMLPGMPCHEHRFAPTLYEVWLGRIVRSSLTQRLPAFCATRPEKSFAIFAD